uniref:Uncharacterized protein n=1 Tax=Parascaris equorum TaxID=6256 RepID=A0A914RHB8_PAREQ
MSGVISWSQVARCMLTVSVIRLSLAALDFSELTDVSYDMTIRDVPLGFEQLSLAPPLATSDEDVADLLSAIKVVVVSIYLAFCVLCKQSSF